jgi:hypothetical protein
MNVCEKTVQNKSLSGCQKMPVTAILKYQFEKSAINKKNIRPNAGGHFF